MNKSSPIVSCAGCRWFVAWPKQPNPERGTFGDCRRTHPQLCLTHKPELTRFETKFPSTKETDFCGDFEAKPKETNENQKEQPVR